MLSNKKIIHLVEYSDIVQNPRETMNKIYNFLELPNFKHNFDNIEKIEKENDSSVFKTLYNIDGVGEAPRFGIIGDTKHRIEKHDSKMDERSK